MRIIKIKTFPFESLSNEAKQNAIKVYKDELLYEGKHGSSYFPEWAIDDCALLEPKDKIMTSLLGKDYYENNGNQFVFKNTRKRISFDDYDLIITDALEITNKEMFLTFLGISKEFHERISYEFYSDTSTCIELDYDYEGMKKKEFETMIHQIKEATRIFDNHIQDVLGRIKQSIEWRYSDEAIEDELLNSDYEFDIRGNRIDIGDLDFDTEDIL